MSPLDQIHYLIEQAPKLKPCPFCNGKVGYMILDDEKNLIDKGYIRDYLGIDPVVDSKDHADPCNWFIDNVLDKYAYRIRIPCKNCGCIMDTVGFRDTFDGLYKAGSKWNGRVKQ